MFAIVEGNLDAEEWNRSLNKAVTTVSLEGNLGEIDNDTWSTLAPGSSGILVDHMGAWDQTTADGADAKRTIYTAGMRPAISTPSGTFLPSSVAHFELT